MSSDQGWFESDEDYRHRVAQEADERTIEHARGSAASQGWFEGDNDYRDRLAKEANQYRIEESTGESPSQGWFESDDDYRDRIERVVNERVIEDSTGSAPSRRWLEGDDDYKVRVRRAANEQIVERGAGSSPRQGWFEGDHDYRSRIAHEARQVRARERPRIENQADTPFGSEGDGTDLYSKPLSIPARRSPSSGGIGWMIAVIVVLACGALGAQWLTQRLDVARQTEAAERARAAEQTRSTQAARATERARAERALVGQWHYSNRTDGRPAALTISRQGDSFIGEYRSGGRLEPLIGQLQADNRLRLANARQSGKIVRPGTWYEGDFSQEAWLQLGNDDTVLFASFASSGPTFVIERTAEAAPAYRR